MIRKGIPESMQQKARYEIAVAQLRGLGDLRPADDIVSCYIAQAVGTDDASELIDACVLLLYCIGARGRGLTNHDETRLLSWNGQLQSQVLRLLTETELPGRRCVLLEALGFLRAQPDLVAAKLSGVEYRMDPDMRRLTLDTFEEMAQHKIFKPIHVPLVDLTGAFDAWKEMVETLPRAPLFPVEQLCKMFRISAHALIDDSRFDFVASSIDARIAEVVGGDAAASNARSRAMMFYERGRLRDALRELHRARLGWLSGETSEGLVLATLFMSQIYLELELPTAAKYSAMIAAWLARDGHEELYARACFIAAKADYQQGAWISSMLMASHAARAHLLFAEDAHNWERHPHLEVVFFDLLTIRGIARAAGGIHEVLANEIIERAGANGLLDEILKNLDGVPWWEDLGKSQLSDRVAKDLGRVAFSDGGERRSLSWRALGATWIVEFANTYDATVVGERLAAFIQIVLAEMAIQDPVLLPTRVVFDVAPQVDGGEIEIQSQSDGYGTRWKVRLPKAAGYDLASRVSLEKETLSVVLLAVADISVLPPEELSQILETMLADGLPDKLAFGITYDVAFEHLVDRELFEEERRKDARPMLGSFNPTPPTADDLTPNGCGLHYDSTTSIEFADRRYKMIKGILRASLPALARHAPFREVVRTLKKDGWKDWHILLAVLHIVQNRRLELRLPPQTEAELRTLRERFTEPERLDDPAPLEFFTEKALREAIQFSWMATLDRWGLKLRQNPPDIRAVETLLATRYSYWTDDAPHDDLFGGNS